MNELIARLKAIEEYTKDIHYNVRGLTAIELHKYADEVGADLSEFIDTIKEVCLLGNGKRPLTSVEYMQRAIKLIPEIPDNDKEKFEVLHDIIMETLRHIDTIKGNTADMNLLGNIAENLQKSKGLINLIIE